MQVPNYPVSPKVIQAQKNTRKNTTIKGGSVPTPAALMRQSEVEKYMVAGLSATKIAALRKPNSKKALLGSYKTILKDIDIIRSRWMERDPEWLFRAKEARIEAVMRLKAQLVRQNILLTAIKNNTYETKDIAKALTYAESQLTLTITRIYEIESDLDPEQYVDARIQARINAKVEAAETTRN